MSVESAVEAAVLHSDADGIRRIRLNRPEAANALRPVDRDRLIELVNEADEDHAIRVVVIAANGRHFCSGADVTGIARAKSGDPLRACETIQGEGRGIRPSFVGRVGNPSAPRRTGCQPVGPS